MAICFLGGVVLSQQTTIQRKSRLLLSILLIAALLFMGIFGLIHHYYSTRSVLASTLKPDDRQRVRTFLQQAKDDLSVIHAFLMDPELDFQNEGSDLTGEGSSDDVGYLQSIAAEHRVAIEHVYGKTQNQAMSDYSELERYQEAQKALFLLSIDFLSEYEQILVYSETLIVVGDKLTALSDVDDSDIEQMYLTYQQTLNEAVEVLESTSVPTFLESMNEELIDGLIQMDDAVYYSLSAVAMGDPVRMSSADYRLDLVVRRFDQILSGVDQDVTDRQNKLMQEIDEINRLYDGLDQWLTANITRLEQN